MIMNYVFPAIMERNTLSGRYIVIFPDLPDPICQGETPEASDPVSRKKREDAEVIVLEADPPV
nr:MULTISPECIES: hypothetical protein [Desulfitobacterium]